MHDDPLNDEPFRGWPYMLAPQSTNSHIPIALEIDTTSTTVHNADDIARARERLPMRGRGCVHVGVSRVGDAMTLEALTIEQLSARLADAEAAKHELAATEQVLAVLVARLGGTVKISDQELRQIDRSTITTSQDGHHLVITVKAAE